jgi:UDP-N-acetylmuramoyl-tripeptide--D-alanyl-D-alanine ligase
MLELGAQAAERHAELAGPLEAASIDLVFCAGPLMKALYDALPARRRGAYAADAEALSPLVAEAPAAGDVVMVKGSRDSRAAALVAALKALDGRSEGAR